MVQIIQKKIFVTKILKQLPSRSKFISYIEKSSFDKRNYKVDFLKYLNLKLRKIII